MTSQSDSTAAFTAVASAAEPDLLASVLEGPRSVPPAGWGCDHRPRCGLD